MDFVYRGISYSALLPRTVRFSDNTFLQKYRGVIWKSCNFRDTTRLASVVDLQYRGVPYSIAI